MTHTSRRQFVQTAAFGAAALAAITAAPAAYARRQDEGDLPGGVGIDGKTPPKATKKLNVLFLGGTGFLGPHTVHYLQQRGHNITLFNRQRRAPQMFQELETLKGDRDPDKDDGLNAIAQQIEAGRRWDAVIDTSGYVQRTCDASADLLKDAADQYLFVSTACVYKNWTEVFHGDEDTPLEQLDDPTTEDVGVHYCALKGYCEQAVEKHFAGRATIVRPGLIVGPRDFSDRFTYWPVRVQRGGEVLAPGNIDDPTQYIDVRDLGEFMVHCIEGQTVGRLNALGPASKLSIAGLLYGCKAVSGSDAQFTWADADWLESNNVQAWVDMPMWSNPKTSGVFTWSNKRAVDAGLKFRPLADTVRDTLAWWATLPEDRQAKLRAGITHEREKEMLKKWHAEHAE
ncbi:MAG: NAD-dependent epimerase/dehydratase family protein [Phycisphaerales bacterium]|nr:NAD-dependent epimerase/dehydratase family protein [Phycisphaerales bacterium]